MSLILGLIGLGIALALTVRNARGERLSQLVFLFSAVHALYVFPKVLALSESNTPAADYFRANGVTFTTAYMALLCYLATIVTYSLLAPSKGIGYGIADMRTFTRRVAWFSIGIGGLGLIAFLGLMSRNGGLINYFFGFGFYQMELSGINAWLIFLSRFIYPAIAAMALLATLRPSWFSLSMLALLSALPLMNVVILFRRSDLLFLGFIAIHALTVSGRWKFNRLAMLASIGALSLLIILFPYIRQASLSAVTGFNYQQLDLSVQERVADSFEVSENDEIVRAASTIQNVYRSGNYGLGTFIWNSLINQFVPATLVGVEAKSSLYLGNRDQTGDFQSFFDQESHFYVAPMGFAQVYEQFGPFGWIIFAAFGALIALVERKSSKLSNRIFLMLAIPLVCLAATNDITSMPARLLTFWILTRFLGKARFLIVPSSVWKGLRLSKIFKSVDMRGRQD